MASYNTSKHIWKIGKSTIEMGYIATEGDVQQYQSAEYDVIRFDEMTHFTESMYTYMISRVRGTRPFPRHVKSTANPGSVGHTNAKSRFIDIGAPMEVHRCEGGHATVYSGKAGGQPVSADQRPAVRGTYEKPAA